jgi:hypothetical protein
MVFSNEQIVRVSVGEAETFIKEVDDIMSQMSDGDEEHIHQSWLLDSVEHMRALLNAVKILESPA